MRSDYGGSEDFEEIERRLNIHRLQNEARELAGGEATIYEAEDAPTEVREAFGKHVVAFERAPRTTLSRRIEAAGISVPHEDELDEVHLGLKLWQVIDFLATQQCFLLSTDHVGDRELYRFLRDEVLPQPIPDLPPHPDAHTGWDLLGSGSAEDMAQLMRFYADDEWRERWAEEFPDFEMPHKEAPPFDRDRLLPQAELPEWDEEDEDEEQQD